MEKNDTVNKSNTKSEKQRLRFENSTMKEPNNQAWRVWETFTKMTFELGLEEVVRAYQVKIIIR